MEANQFFDDKAAHLRNLIAVHTRRLQHLEITAATHGIDTPPHILIELDDLTEKIRSLGAELLKLSAQGQQQEDEALKVIDDVTQQLTSDQIREFITFAEGKVTIVPESFRSTLHTIIVSCVNFGGESLYARLKEATGNQEAILKLHVLEKWCTSVAKMS